MTDRLCSKFPVLRKDIVKAGIRGTTLSLEETVLKSFDYYSG